MTTYSPFIRSARFSWLPAGALVALFFATPLTVFAVGGLAPLDFSRVFGEALCGDVWWFTLWQAVASVALTMIVALPATWLTARNSFIGRRLLVALLTLPFLLPTVVVGVAFLALLPESLHYTALAVILAHAYFNVAVFVRVVGPVWSTVPTSLTQVAQSLGASPLTAFRTVTLPLIRRALLSATGITFLFCFTSYGVVRILGGPRNSTVETEIYLRAVGLGDVSTAIALGILQVCVLAAVAITLGRYGRGVSLGFGEASSRGHITLAIPVLVGGGYLALICAPIVVVVYRSFFVRGNLSWAGWDQVVTGQFGAAVSQSLQYAVVASLLTVGVAYGVAHSVVHGRLRFLETASAATLTVSSVTLGLAIIVTFDRPPFDLRSWWLITPIAHTLVALPIAVRAMVPVIEAVPAGLTHAAASLGAPPLRNWVTVQWPLVRHGVLTATAMSFAVSIGEFGATSFLTRRANETMPVAIERLLGRPGDINQLGAHAMASILIFVCVCAVATLERSRVEAIT